MKKIAKIILFNLAAVASAYSQDMISLRNGEEIKANIKEVSDREVVFTYDKETVINKLPTAQIAQIKFKSGRVQKFELANQQNYEPYNSPANHSPYSFNIPEPDYVGTILLLDESGKVLESLENQKVATRSNLSASTFIVGIGTAKTRQYVKGKSSPLRIKKGKVLLLAKTISNQVNPNEVIGIFKLDQGRNERSIIVTNANSFGISKSNNIDYLPFKAYPYKETSFLIELNIDQAGEYAVTLDGSNFNLFGID
jgi:hypothetical protein